MNRILSSAISIPPEKWVGWGFHPTKFELINDYLKAKTLGNGDEDGEPVIGEVKLCEFEPRELLAQSKIKSDDYVGYFFCPRDFKYSKSKRSNRKTKTGFWKPTGKFVEIKNKRTKKRIGTKRTMVFYEKAHPKPLRTAWVAEEYEYIPDFNKPKKRDFVLIKLKKNPEKKIHKKKATQSTTLISDLEGEPSHCMASDCENQNPNEMTATSPCEESELIHHETSDFENLNLNQISFAFDGECSRPMKMSSVFENRYRNDEDELSSFPSDFVNQNPNGMTANSPCESNCLMASDFENQISLVEFEGKGSSSIVMPLDFKNQSPCNKGELSSSVTSNSFFIGSEYVHPMASDFKNQSPEELTLMLTSDSENQISPFEGEWSSPLGMSSDFKNQSPFDKGISFDVENKHLERQYCAQGPEEGKCCPLTETPLDFAFPNPCEPKMSNLEEFYGGHLMVDSPSDHLAEDVLPEVSLQLMEEIEVIRELDNILNSQPQP